MATLTNIYEVKTSKNKHSSEQKQIGILRLKLNQKNSVQNLKETFNNFLL